ncbi:putative c2h2 zinc finger protein [Phaeomoniella chlamydospora]|uniref:Protein SIP5 n=1 Tax=Phaeomoniella chlamydospora TaxID=158046 RepID=A0A0G2GUW2_PHACM|nr:putative c2h2 zinc finger protein [Phaeomoniella chlamydospora]
MSPAPGRRRGTSLSTTAPGVITTDRVRPDWATKLASARAHAARRSAAATALHTAAYLMGNNNREGPDARTLGGLGRRLRRTGSGENSPGTSSAHLNALAYLAERAQQQQSMHRAQSNESNDGSPGVFLPPPRGSSNRRSRVDDLEEMMMMEAIRLSLASEEERRKKEEKEAKKESKKKEKADRKAEKAARKSGLYTLNSNTSSTGFESGESATGSGLLGRTESATSIPGQQVSPASGKGKAVERDSPGPPSPLNIASPSTSTSTNPQPIPGLSVSPSSPTFQTKESSSFTPSATDPLKRSQLRHMSTASSSASSLVDQAGTSVGADAGFPSGSSTPGQTPGGRDDGAGNEPMFNFRSLAATLIDEEPEKEKASSGNHIEDVSKPTANTSGVESTPKVPNATTGTSVDDDNAGGGLSSDASAANTANGNVTEPILSGTIKATNQEDSETPASALNGSSITPASTQC